MPIKEVQQTVKQHAVPQNIMQVEFKVIGSLTMRQFFYLIVAAVAAVGTYKSGLPGFVALPAALFIALGGLAVAFVPVEDRGLDQWIANFFSAIYMPTQRIWRKEIAPPSYFLYQNAALLKSELMAVAPTASRRKLEQYLEHEGGEKAVDPLDFQEDAYIQKVRDSFLKAAPTTTTAPSETKPYTPYIPTPSYEQVPQTPVQIPEQVLPKVPTITAPGILQEAAAAQQAVQTPPVQRQTPTVEIPLPKQVVPQVSEIKTMGPVEIKIPKHRGIGPVPISHSITPDRLAGRRFTHLSRTEGEIILPIRGERVLKTTEETIKEDINEKANQLTKLVEQIKQEQPVAAQQKEVPINKVIEDTMYSLKGENEKLLKQIENLKQSAAQPSKSAAEKEEISAHIETLQKDKETADQQITSLQQKIAEMEEKLKQVANEPPKVVVQKVVEKVNVPFIPADYSKQQKAQPAPIPQKAVFTGSPLSNVPNIINGVVKDSNQKLIEAAVVIVKDAKGDTIRALKTNKLGEFAITTPVPNGSYIIEISKEQDGVALKFDRISLEVKGEVLPPAEFIGKL